MGINAASVAYATVGGIVLYSGFKGATLSDTVKTLLSGSTNVSDTETLGSTSSDTGTASGGTAVASQSATANQQLAAEIIADNPAYAGWDSGQEWQDLVSLWDQESGWSATADNPASGAYGIPQALPYSKMPTAAWPVSAGGQSDPTSQIEWGLSYIQSTYGSPVLAWAHEQQYDWY